MAPADCARLGAIAAAEVISHVGARPQTSLAELARGPERARPGW
jgi:sugar/nucleoside kinase (ribokinase family)